jgi:hypothetical protein
VFQNHAEACLDANKIGIFGARRADATGWERENPRRRLGIAKIRRSGNLSLHKVDILWMAV